MLLLFFLLSQSIFGALVLKSQYDNSNRIFPPSAQAVESTPLAIAQNAKLRRQSYKPPFLNSSSRRPSALNNDQSQIILEVQEKLMPTPSPKRIVTQKCCKFLLKESAYRYCIATNCEAVGGINTGAFSEECPDQTLCPSLQDQRLLQVMSAVKTDREALNQYRLEVEHYKQNLANYAAELDRQKEKLKSESISMQNSLEQYEKERLLLQEEKKKIIQQRAVALNRKKADLALLLADENRKRERFAEEQKQRQNPATIMPKEDKIIQNEKSTLQPTVTTSKPLLVKEETSWVISKLYGPDSVMPDEDYDPGVHQ